VPVASVSLLVVPVLHPNCWKPTQDPKPMTLRKLDGVVAVVAVAAI